MNREEWLVTETFPKNLTDHTEFSCMKSFKASPAKWERKMPGNIFTDSELGCKFTALRPLPQPKQCVENIQNQQNT